MAGFRLDVFKGIRPRISPRLLPPGEAQTATNLRLGSGSLEPWNGITQIEEACATRVQTIHRMRNDGDPFWLSFTSDVDVARGPVPNDALERTYYTGEELSEPRMTYLGLADPDGGCAPDDYRRLGIPAPDTAPDVEGDALPSESVTGTMTLGSMNTNFVKGDFCIEDNLPANLNYWLMGQDSGYDATGTIRVFSFDFYIGQEMRVASVVDPNTVTLEDANGGTFLSKTVQQARVQGGGITQFRTDDSGTSRDGHFRFYVPNGVEVTLPTHGLQEGDIITVTSIPSTISLVLEQPGAGGLLFGAESDNGAGTAGSNTWPSAPVSVAPDDFWIAGTRAYPFVDVWANATGPAGGNDFNIEGNFAWRLTERGGIPYDDIAANIESRVYVYTYVSALGEEGPPSPASEVVTIPTGGEVVVDNFAAAPSTQREITHRRIYRANTGSEDTIFEFVTEITVGTSSYTDDVSDIELGEVLQTETWDPPSSSMVGITALPNGGMAGFFGKTLCLAEPFFPHAWPPEYRIAVEHDIVGLGVLPNGIAVLTKGGAWLAAGDHPRAMSLRHFTDSQACVSKKSIVNTIDSVIYASPDGLARIGSGGFELITEKHVKKREWQASFSPSTMHSFWHDSKYIAFHPGRDGNDGFVFDPSDDTVGLTLHDINIVAGYLDAEEDDLYIMPVEDITPMVVAISDDGTNTARAMSSPDGINWTDRTTPSSPSDIIWKCGFFFEIEGELEKWIFGRYITSGQSDNNVLMQTEDGVTFALISSVDLVNLCNQIAWAPPPNFGEFGRLIAAGSEGGTSVFTYSDDGGVTWSAAQTWAHSATAGGIAWSEAEGVWGAVSAGAGFFTSPTGLTGTWTEVATSNDPTGEDQARSMLLYDELREIWIFQNNTDIRTSSDGGVTWTVRLSGVVPEEVCYSEDLDLYLAVMQGGNAYTSADGGVTWTARTIGQTNQWCGCTWSRLLGLFIIVSRNGTNRVATSPDGVTWTLRSASSAKGWEAVIAGGTAQLHNISKWDDDADSPMTMVWKSGKTVCPYPLNLGAARIVADAYPVTFKLYNDRGTLVTTRTITSEEVIRLPGGYLTSWFEVQIEGTKVVRTVHVAETVAELLQG